MTEQILACPYCGSENVILADNTIRNYWCKCFNCGATGPVSITKSDAVLLWNAASNALAAKDAEIARLAEALADTEEQRHETVGKLSLALIREAASNKRQDELEAEIEKLKQWLQNCMDEEKKRQDHAIERQSKLSSELQLERKRLKDCQDMYQLNLECHYDTKERLTAERDEARKVARRLYRDNQLKDGDITRMCEELDKVNALRPIGAPPIIAYYTPHGQPVSVTNNPVGYTLKR